MMDAAAGIIAEGDTTPYAVRKGQGPDGAEPA
jgi:hypothetical protein